MFVTEIMEMTEIKVVTEKIDDYCIYSDGNPHILRDVSIVDDGKKVNVQV